MGVVTSLQPRRLSLLIGGCGFPEAAEACLFTLDKIISMNNHVSAVCKSVHYHISALRHIRSSISEDMAKMVVCAVVGSRLDYANSVLLEPLRKTSANSKKHRISSPVSLPVLLNPAVHVLSSSSSIGSRLNTASTSK